MAGARSMAATGATPQRLRALPARHLVESAGYVLFTLFVVFACFTFLRPAPYDVVAFPAMLVWLVLGVRLHRSSVPFVALMLVYELALVVALVPYIAEPDPALWTVQSLYLMATAIFFVMFFAYQTARRVELTLKAYVASCLFAAAAGILSYFSDPGLIFAGDGRAAGVFEDPNVLGSFLLLGALYLLRGLLTGEGRHPLLAQACLVPILACIFLSFSRGSWGALVLGATVMTAMTFAASPTGVRRRIAAFALIGLALGTMLVLGLLSIGDVSERFSDRAQLMQSYDEGVTGRFGNQFRSIPMLIERPEGFGPLRFRLFFGLEPHNSYIGGFANGGWAGGLAFIGLVLLTIFVGLRLCLTPSPFQRQAQVVFPALLMFFLQAFQIDIDHWRHLYIMFGMVWGLEAGRQRWLAATTARLTEPAARPRAASGPRLLPQAA